MPGISPKHKKRHQLLLANQHIS